MDTVVSFPGDEAWEFSGGGFQGSYLPLFGRRSHVAFGDGTVVVGTADEMEYGVYSLDGRLLRIARVPGYDLSLSAAEVADARDIQLAEARELAILREAFEGLTRRTHPPRLPASPGRC